MSNEIMRFDFGGRAIEFRPRGGQPGMTAPEVADFLGFADGRKVTNLFNDNDGEFRSDETWFSIDVNQVPRPGERAKKSYAKRIYGPIAVLRVAMLGGTPTCAEARDFILYEVLPTYQRLKEGRDASRMSELEAALANAKADLRMSLGTTKSVATLASRMFEEAKKAKKREREAELFTQGRLLGLSAHLSRLEEKVLAAIAAHGPFDSVADLAKKIRTSIAETGEAVGALHTRGHVRRVEGKVGLARPGNGTSPHSDLGPALDAARMGA